MDAIAKTARFCAAHRAFESDRSDHLFSDPLARALAGAEGLAMLEHSRLANVPDSSPYFAIRTKFFDDLAVRYTAAGIHQVVIVGAGMDTRGFRLAWPAGVVLYELDRPDLLSLKEEILSREKAEPRCRRIPLGVDLDTQWVSALENAGFVPTYRSLWLVEGLFFYLEQENVHSVLRQMSNAAVSGSCMGADFVSQSYFTSEWTRAAMRLLADQGIAWRFGIDDPEILLAPYAWRAQVLQPGEDGANFGRWPYPTVPRTYHEVPRSFLVVGQRG